MEKEREGKAEKSEERRRKNRKKEKMGEKGREGQKKLCMQEKAEKITREIIAQRYATNHLINTQKETKLFCCFSLQEIQANPWPKKTRADSTIFLGQFAGLKIARRFSWFSRPNFGLHPAREQKEGRGTRALFFGRSLHSTFSCYFIHNEQVLYPLCPLRHRGLRCCHEPTLHEPQGWCFGVRG